MLNFQSVLILMITLLAILPNLILKSIDNVNMPNIMPYCAIIGAVYGRLNVLKSKIKNKASDSRG